jgi:hypothetical protein
MIIKRQFLLFLTGKKIGVYKYNSKSKDYYEQLENITFDAYDESKESLYTLILDHVKKYDISKLSVLIGNDVAYYLEIKNIDPTNKKRKDFDLIIKNKLVKLIPDQIEELQWGYLLRKDKSKGKYTVLFFAPISAVYSKLKYFFQKTEIEVGKIELEEIFFLKYDNYSHFLKMIL